MAVPRSALFDDVYFSADNGLHETMHVFLEGNDLPSAWQGCSDFVITELGFGTGLNFLATWNLFEKTAKIGQSLHYISIEKFPLSPSDIEKALKPWASHFENRLAKLLDNYPMRVPGFHRLVLSNNVILTLIFDDVNKALWTVNQKVLACKPKVLKKGQSIALSLRPGHGKELAIRRNNDNRW